MRELLINFKSFLKIRYLPIKSQEPHIIVSKIAPMNPKNGLQCGCVSHIHPKDLWKWKLKCIIQYLTGSWRKEFVPKNNK